MSKFYIAIICSLFLWSCIGQSACIANLVEPESECGVKIASETAAETADGNVSETHVEKVAETSTYSLPEIDNALLEELVKLSKFNIHFHIEANHHQPWRQLTYPAGREIGTALSFAATLTDLNEQAEGLSNPRLISRSKLKNATICGITGNAISGGASSLELAQNTWVMMKAKRNGYSPAASIEFVKDIVSKTDKLLTDRDRFAEQEPDTDRRQLRQLETALVRRIRQQLLYEFATWSCHSRDQAWRENTFYALDAGQNFTRMGGAILALRAFERPRLARQAVIYSLVANSLATVNPIVRNVTGVIVRKHQEKRIAKEIPMERPSALSLDDLKQKLALDGDPDFLKRVTALTNRTQAMDTQLTHETREIERFRQVAQQQSISGPLIGLTGVTSSTLATIAVYGYPRDIDTANKLGFAGRITQGTGQAYALINTPYTMVKGMIRNRRLKERGELPSQILKERLQRLDALQASVPASPRSR
ncbi:MAG: hypothetical protein DKT66_06155 [Candidatus Melainabacteria bacterium]|nr:MAG: hypothetical protein DKT66_06155 [Candidatus Melainabacteria bacterium]